MNRNHTISRPDFLRANSIFEASAVAGRELRPVESGGVAALAAAIPRPGLDRCATIGFRCAVDLEA